MSNQVRLALVLVSILLLLVAGVAQAQDIRPTPTNIPPPNEEGGDGQVRGSIRGNVYEDRNGDGRCINTEDRPATDIPVEFTSIDGQHTLFLQSGDEGSFGLVAAGLGTWTVTIRPPENYVATSPPAIQVTLTPEERLVTGVDFCVRQRGVSGGGPSGPGGLPPGYHPPVLLPESGTETASTTTVINGLIVAGLVGGLLVGFGLLVAARNRVSGAKSTSIHD